MKVSEKLTKVDTSVTVYLYDNGYMVEIGGKDHEDDWATARIMCTDLKEVNAVIEEVSQMPRDN